MESEGLRSRDNLFGPRGTVTAHGPPLPPARRLTLPGRGTTFVRDLSGPPGAPVLFLLHGLSATGDLNWFPSFATLGRQFRVLSIDHRGHGRGIRSRRPFRLADVADDVAAAADELGVERFIAVGYSMGGPVAQLVWHRHRDRVSGLVLCATARNFRGSPAHRLFFTTALPAMALGMSLVPASTWRPLGERLLTVHPDDHPLRQWTMGEMRTMDPRVIIQAMLAVGNFSSHQWIGDVDVPAAVVVTTKDRFVPPERQYKLAHAIPGATVHEVDGDHAVCVIGGRRFVPVLAEACASVAGRLSIARPA